MKYLRFLTALLRMYYSLCIDHKTYFTIFWVLNKVHYDQCKNGEFGQFTGLAWDYYDGNQDQVRWEEVRPAATGTEPSLKYCTFFRRKP